MALDGAGRLTGGRSGAGVHPPANWRRGSTGPPCPRVGRSEDGRTVGADAALLKKVQTLLQAREPPYRSASKIPNHAYSGVRLLTIIHDRYLHCASAITN